MTFSIEIFLLIAAILLLISLLAGKTSYKFGIPTLLLFLVIGWLAGVMALDWNLMTRYSTNYRGCSINIIRFRAMIPKAKN
jgi:NhaP-type Na+/H+ and K+/H+ antiporter